ncbi:hypothetical protein [Nocardia brasiliensis]|uniref:hypothetical protein n=1 Tax=Nocardia brasiliensis TaxID=37326 RepID=UPI0024547629|nr:hypothetical protein [Nocardia brasiliensis]
MDLHSLLTGSPHDPSGLPGSPAWPGTFPDAKTLWAAVQRPDPVHIGGHSDSDDAVVQWKQWAQELAGLYARHGCGPLPIEARHRVDQVINEVNAWVVRHVRRAVGGARMEPMSMGEVLTRLVRMAKSFDEVPVPDAHPMGRRIAQQLIAYEDYARGLIDGTADMPDYLPGLAES